MNTRKILAAAAVKVFRAFKKEPGEWSKLMMKATGEYGSMREKRQKTKREKMLWPKGGYKAVWEAAQKFKKGIDLEPTSLKGLRELQDLWLLEFFGTHTPRHRGDAAPRPGPL